jgi:hypothetical protein
MATSASFWKPFGFTNEGVWKRILSMQNLYKPLNIGFEFENNNVFPENTTK